MSHYKTIALVPMKAHSERVPGKNFRVFAGMPLFYWTLKTLLAIADIELIVINTDARSELETHPIISDPRVLVRDRPQELCGDDVSMNLIIGDDLASVNAETYLMTHTTNPLMAPDTVRDAMSQYEHRQKKGTHDSLFSVNRVQTRFYRQDGSPVNHDPDNLVRTQDLESWYEENSNLYIFNRDSFASTSARIGKCPYVYETPRLDSLDIDTEEDWDLAELVAKHRHMIPAAQMLG